MSDRKGSGGDGFLMTYMFGHDNPLDGLSENGGLSGNEVDTHKVNDSGESQVFDPCEALWKATAANRLNTTPEGAKLEKRWADNDPFALAIQKATRMRKDGNVMKLYDAAGNLLVEKEVSE
ncbi:MAG TPA: hypothetical protein VOA88_20980 [Candidatus Dormibacteraeota bacterium]|nr:hypothetical protein [Candidatus Dormibacteraeota bacterium]